MTARRRLALGAGLLLFLDALFMTAITVTTAGFEEVRPPNDQGRAFTIFPGPHGISPVRVRMA